MGATRGLPGTRPCRRPGPRGDTVRATAGVGGGGRRAGRGVGPLPVSRGNLSFDFRAKRFVGGAGYPVAERHQRWMGSFATEERSALLSREGLHAGEARSAYV